jgi:hypothetical protein
MSILILGDSHSDIFQNIPDTNRFNVGQCDLGLFTTKRFLDDDDVDLWSRLTPWFQNNKSDTLVITSGEIDVRAHFWRHLPRHYTSQQDITTYVRNNVEQFYNKLCKISDLYNIKKIIVWGAPTAGEKAAYNSSYPFVGSSKTRNILTHIWNREFSKFVEIDHRFSLCSAFYHFIEDDYTTSNHSPSHDGVHWEASLGNMLWTNCISIALNKSGLVLGVKWNSVVNDQFDITESASRGLSKYDTWVRTDQPIVGLESPTINLRGKPYTFVKSEHRVLLPDTYNEIGLEKQ